MPTNTFAVPLASSRFKGAYWHKPSRRWLVQMRVNGKKTHIGYFSGEEEAARAYDRAHVDHFGEFARPNFPS